MKMQAPVTASGMPDGLIGLAEEPSNSNEKTPDHYGESTSITFDCFGFFNIFFPSFLVLF